MTFALRLTLLASLVLGLAACSESIDDTSCNRNTDCAAGNLCDPDGACVAAADLSIAARTLTDAVVGETDWSEPLQASGGLPPYSWSMTITNGEAYLDWLEIDPQTGELRPLAGQAPTQAANDLLIEVTVRDRSNAGEGQETSRPFDLAIKECDADVICEQAVGTACHLGVYVCTLGVLATECTDLRPSVDFDRCGDGCAGCPAESNRCVAGECKCNTADPCVDPETCCDEGCFDLQVTAAHCGACGTDCTAIPNVEGPACQAGVCVYANCTDEYLDCDGEVDTGCEIFRDLNNCSACGDLCTDTTVYENTENQSCQPTGCAFDCLAGFADCDNLAENGCEADLSTVLHCGGCGIDCQGNVLGTACIMGGPTGHMCGCTDEALDCPADRICCGGLCLAHTEDHCGDCDTECAIGTGGLVCVPDIGNDPPANCECQDTINHTDCKDIYSFSQASCRTDTLKCTCLGDVNCQGTVADMCCQTAGVPGCTSLLTDVDNCGVCSVLCEPGETCNDGACSCSGNICPSNSGAPDCLAGTCSCFANQGNPCPPGQFCCLSQGCCFGGCGGPDEDCSDHCTITLGGTWCWDGCCETCATEADCPPLPGP